MEQTRIKELAYDVVTVNQKGYNFEMFKEYDNYTEEEVEVARELWEELFEDGYNNFAEKYEV